MGRNIILWAGVVLLCLGSSDARSSGADPAACTNMLPMHGGANPQTGAAPYTVTVSPANYTFSSSPTLTVTITATGASTFQGFLLEARNADPSLSQTDILGTWTAAAGQQLLCAGSPGAALTHSPKATVSTVTAVWNPVSGANPNPGHVKFLATIVDTFAVFWVKEESPIVYELSTAAITTAAPTTAGPTVTSAPISVSDSGCGSTKGCFRHPSGCDPTSDCLYFATWEAANSTHVDFVLQGKKSGYVALAVSDDQKMGSDSVMACVRDATTFAMTVEYGTNTGRSYAASTVTPSDIVLRAASYANGDLTCSFTRPKVSAVAGVTDLGSTKKYLLMAVGPTFGSTVMRHDISGDGFPTVSHVETDLVETVDISSGVIKYPMVKAHGSLMLVAWMVCGTVGVLMARYFKQSWPEKKLFGTAIWFGIHRPIMIFNMLCTIAAFVIIFVDVKGWTKMSSQYHPIAGVVITVCVIANPIIGALRCDKDHPKRPIFNISHRIFGYIGFYGSFGVIAIGLYQQKASSVKDPFWIYIAWIIFHVVTEISIAVITCMYCKQAKKEAGSSSTTKYAVSSPPQAAGEGMELKQAGQADAAASSSKAKKWGTIMNGLLFLHVSVTIILCVVIIALVAIN